MRYAVINEAGHVLNYIVWDGQSDYDPGEGNRLESAPLPDPEDDDE
jgi:hypothetical protein